MGSIRAKLGAVLLGVLLLVMGSVVATSVTVRAQASDALVINLAGRQRMLTQAMAKASLGIAGRRTTDYREELRHTADLFDRTLAALLDGGQVPYGDRLVALPAAWVSGRAVGPVEGRRGCGAGFRAAHCGICPSSPRL